MKRRLLVVALALTVIVGVYGLKVWHAVGVCEDAGGEWTGSDCVFHEKTN